jgi:hypothetical protein
MGGFFDPLRWIWNWWCSGDAPESFVDGIRIVVPPPIIRVMVPPPILFISVPPPTA